MTAIEERLAFVEGRMTEHSQMFPDLREAMGRLERQLDGRLDRMGNRLDRMDDRLDRMEGRLDRLEARLDAGLSELRTAMTRHFQWIVGIQVTTLVTVVATLLAVSAR